MNGYEEFGKYLVASLGIDDGGFDWDFIVRKYSERSDKTRKPGLMWINWTVCTYFNVKAYDVKIRQSSKRIHTIPRHTAQYLASILFGYTQTELSDFYGITHRSLISNNNLTVENRLASDKHYQTDVKNITNKLLGYERDHEPRASTVEITGGVQIPENEERHDMSLDGNG